MIAIVLLAAGSLTLKFPLAKTLEETRKADLCGRYVAKPGKSLYHQFTFEGGVTVNTDAGMGDNARPYFVHDGHLFVMADKALHELKISGQAFTGIDEFTNNDTFKRAAAAMKKCAPFAATKVDEAKVQHVLCYLHGVDLQGSGKQPAALAQYESCCQAGDSVSCNKQGMFLALGAGGKPDEVRAFELFMKSCEMGYGGGCSNAGDVKMRTGKKPEAMQLFKRGCKLRFMDACLRELDL